MSATPTPKPGIFERLKLRWNIESNLQLFLILTVFALTGSLSVKLAKYVMDFMGLNKEEMSAWVYYPVRIISVFPLYQVLLILIGTALGQFKFFWAFEKKMLAGFARPFTGKKQAQSNS